MNITDPHRAACMVRGLNFFTKPIKYCMRLHVDTLKGESTVSEALSLMKKYNSGCVAVLLEGGQLGIVTERDMMFRVLAESKNAGATKLKDVATVNPITVTENSSLESALRTMRDRKLRRLIVVNRENRPVGTLDQRMFFSALVNVLVDEPELAFEGRGFIERYIQDITENFPEPC
jgi:predicted transcriptional regulator